MKKLPYILRLFIASLVLLCSILAITGIFYPFHFLDVQFSALLQRLIVDFSLAAIFIFMGVCLLTMLFGRFYCSVLCPMGILQELISLIFRRKKSHFNNYGFKYLLSALVFGVLIAGSTVLIKYIDPYTMFGSAFTLTIFGMIFAFLILILVFFKGRFFCSNICPVGTILGVISKIAPNKIYMSDECISCGMCERNCLSGCINAKEKTVDNEMCVKCLKCISVCPKNAMKYGFKKKEPVKFSINRRKLIYGISAAAVLAGAYTLGLNFLKENVQKVKNLIFPAGSVNSDRMANKCLNCNLCINNCPNKILEKANDIFPAVHINYEKGSKYCEYECNKCSEICPSGAIKRINLEEKQNTRIAMAMIKDNCVNCGHCISICPKQAIIQENGITRADGSKCIGCGKCKTFCNHNAIEIFGIKNQTVI